MGEILYIAWLCFIGWIWYRIGLFTYTRFRPQIVKVGDLYYIRRLRNVFKWEYSSNSTKYSYPDTLYFHSHKKVFTEHESLHTTSNGHATLEKAQAFRDKYIIKKKTKVKIERVDGLWFMCKNKLSKIKLRKNTNAVSKND